MDYEQLLASNRELAVTISEAYPALADTLATLVSDPTVWRLRRSETIELLGNSIIRRSVNLEFLMADSPVPVFQDVLMRSGLDSTPQVAIPLATLDKGSLTGFSLKDDSGRDLPYLLAGENGVLSALLLLGLAKGDLELTADQTRWLLQIALEVVFSEPEPRECYAKAESFVAHAVLAGSVDEALVRNVAQSLSTGFMLYAVLDRAGPIRRILKFEYLDKAMSGESNWWASFWAALVIPGVARYRLEIPAASQARSFHVDLQVPNAVAITNVDVEIDTDLPTEKAECVVNEHTAYIHCQNVSPGATSRLSFIIKLQRFSGPPLAALYSSLILLLASVTVEMTRLSALAVQNALWIPILLVVPASYALFMGDGGEPHLLTRILRPFRVVGILASLWLVTLALSILLRGDRYAHGVAFAGIVASVVAIGYVLIVWYWRSRS